MKKKILLLVLLIVIVLGAGVGYAYFATDAFKSEKEIFFTYLLKEGAWQNAEVQEQLTKYLAKKESTPYANNGEATITVNSDDDTYSTTEDITSMTVDLEGKTNKANNLAEQTISLDVSQGVIIPIEYKRDGDTYGIQSDLLDTRYIAIRNENLKELVERFDIDSTDIPDKIELEDTQFTEEEMSTLKEKYITILFENLEEELFSKEKVNKETIVTLRMPDSKLKQICLIVLQTLKEDEIILSKIPDSSKAEYQDYIQELIDDLEDVEIDTENEDMFEIKMSIENKVAKKYEIAIIEDNEATVTMIIENVENTTSIRMYDETEKILEAIIKIEKVENDIVATMTIKIEEDGDIMELNATMQYKNIVALDNVEEILSLELSQETEGYEYYYSDSSTEITLDYQNTITFSEDIQIDKFNEENAVIINDISDEELEELIVQIYQKLYYM